MTTVKIDDETVKALESGGEVKLARPSPPLPPPVAHMIRRQVKEARFGPLLRPPFRDLLAHSASTLALIGGVSGYWRRVHGTR